MSETEDLLHNSFCVREITVDNQSMILIAWNKVDYLMTLICIRVCMCMYKCKTYSYYLSPVVIVVHYIFKLPPLLSSSDDSLLI